jgi:hypothetical protein
MCSRIRVIAFVMALATAPAWALAQEAPAQATPLDPYLGREVRVIDVRGVELRGTLLRASTREVHLFTQTTEVRLVFDDIRRVDRRGDSIANGAVIGALWPPVALLAGAGQGFDSSGDALRALPSAMLIFSVLGAGIDALHVGWTNVYRADRTPRATAVAILPTRGGVRVAFATRF